MPNSISKRIILAIVAKLTGPGMPTELTVNRSRTIAVSDDQLPMVSVYRVEEDPTTAGNPRLPSLMQRNLIVEIAINATGDDDACDVYQEWVVKQMIADSKLGGLAKSVTEIKTAWIPDEGSDGESISTFLRYRVEYFTPPGDITSTI